VVLYRLSFARLSSDGERL